MHSKNLKSTLIFLVVALTVVVGITYFSSRTENSENMKSVVDASTPYSLAEVKSHKSESSCWTIIHGNVYDLTDWISLHPGGAQAILGLCGKDGTTAFENIHGGQSRPEDELASLIIGVYKK